MRNASSGHNDRIAELLIQEMFWNVRLGVAAITPAIVLYYVLLSVDSGFARHVVWASITGAWIILLNIYFFLGENWVRDFGRRTVAANTIITAAVATIGTGFLMQVPHILDQNILLTTYGLMIGVLGAAAFVFSCNKYTYILFAAGWALPLVAWLIIFSPDLARRIFGVMFIVYIAAMTFLSRKDYRRRVSLISALETVTSLKKQQDGDYYLTSLLIRPLAVNTVKQKSRVDISFYSEQKKKFEFKNRLFEIGGDINIAHTISLKGIECSVILNADAMGKSIQGAGGALVLGAVFQSIMDRTRAKAEHQNVYPERWMKETFIQLQKVFESFDGSMLVSVFLCVIENHNGAMYCLNAEHPQAVLLRRDRASFLPLEKQHRKLGTPDLNDKLSFGTFMLEPGDVVILGSDGRDDISLGHTTAAGRNINEDEELFLRSVEKTQGILQSLRDEIASHGEITDDLAMVRIAFAAGAEEKDIPQLRQTAVAAFKDRNFPKATADALAYLALRPLDNQIVFLAAVSSMKMSRFSEAIDLAERLRMREPRNVRYISLLIELYLRAGIVTAADKLVKVMQEYYPDHARLPEWLRALVR
jgi:hypothetical protein